RSPIFSLSITSLNAQFCSHTGKHIGQYRQKSQKLIFFCQNIWRIQKVGVTLHRKSKRADASPARAKAKWCGSSAG
ncbi:MAG: hypothetical protein K2K69_00185, partial [Muribaculaceae bacterium]|nr:hypothetical protein [Muribaculaceae bacterium]